MEVSLFRKGLVDCNQGKERKMAIAQENLEKQWENIQPQLLDEYGEGTYTSWIKPLTFMDMKNGCFRLAAPTSFVRDWVKSNYATRMQTLLQGKNDNSFKLDIIVAPQQNVQEISSSTSTLDASDIGSNLYPRFTFDNFVVGKPNELAHAAALKVAESETVAFNPLFLYGGVGLGKTHLMHAIAWQIKKCHHKRRVIYLSAEKFMYQFVRALRFKDTVSFKEQFRSVDVLMIDDVQFIGGKESTQEEFFHTFNALVDQNRQIIISADKSPSDLEGMEERLKSRLGWGLVADIHPTTYELRLGILQAKSEQIGVIVPQKVLEFLAYKISSNVRELEGALTRVVAHSTLVGREITLDTTHEVLRDLLRANDRRVTIDEIQKKVAEYYSIRISDMHSPRRARTVARPRQVAMYLTKVLTTRSLPEIGRKFGGRDHTTVLHAVKKIEELMGEDKTICEDIELLRRTLET